MTTTKPAIPAGSTNRDGMFITAGRIIAAPPIISVSPTNLTVPELKSSIQPAPRTRRFLDRTNFMAPAPANARPIPMLTNHKATFTSTFVAAAPFILGQGEVRHTDATDGMKPA